MAGKGVENMPNPKIIELRPHQDELQQLGELAGIYMDTGVFRNIIELLNMGIAPDTIYNLLKSIRRSRNPKTRSSVSSRKSLRTSNVDVS